jgi:hypothetical protein
MGRCPDLCFASACRLQLWESGLFNFRGRFTSVSDSSVISQEPRFGIIIRIRNTLVAGLSAQPCMGKAGDVRHIVGATTSPHFPCMWVARGSTYVHLAIMISSALILDSRVDFQGQMYDDSYYSTAQRAELAAARRHSNLILAAIVDMQRVTSGPSIAVQMALRYNDVIYREYELGRWTKWSMRCH